MTNDSNTTEPTECTHEMFEWGNCVACGQEDDRSFDDAGETSPVRAGCQNRGWYHDGSEHQHAAATGSTPRSCPHHTGTTA